MIVAYGNDQIMTFENNANATSTPAILTPEVQQAVWFLGASPLARFLTLHTAGGFDMFTLAVGTPATGTVT